jgi:class 3 adenylate cyclase/tetratricopeptide (TPR) repeat protein
MKFCGSCGAQLATASPSEAEAEVGERRQLTVLFCDLVGSTPLAARLDPEDWREVVRTYQRAASEVVTRFEGHVAQYLGDGLLVYFGYPQAHEDDAERAVRAGLAMVEATRALNARLEQEHGLQLAVRVGMHTGPVVVDAAGAVFGETPNVAARVQAVAEPDAVVLTAATHRLVSGWFVVEDAGRQALKGVPEPVQVYRVLRASVVRTRFAARSGDRLTRFVGREDERRMLVSRWELARGGEGQVVHVTGEAGIGKSRLVQSLKEHLAGEPHTWIECAGSPYHEHTPFHALVQMLQQGLAWRGDETVEERVSALRQSLDFAGVRSAESVRLIGPLLDLPVSDQYPPLALSPEIQRRRTFATLAAWLFGIARVQPVVLVVEDIHWLDPSTLELLGLLVEQTATSPVLMVHTARSEFRAPWPLLAHHAQLALNRLSGRQVREMVSYLASDRALSAELLETVVARTDGVPLFVEEVTRTVLDGDGEAAGSRAVPGTLHDSLIARLDRLGAAREVAQVAAVLGREFSYRLLCAVSPLAEPELQTALRQLVDGELVYPRGLPPEATYVFKHALIRDAAYGSMLRSTRRQYHGRIAEILIERMPHVTESQPELVAHHLTEAGRIRPAIDRWREAGRRSLRRSANKEATLHLARALDLLVAQPHSPERDREELELQLELGSATLAAHGWESSEGLRCLARARELCLADGDERERFPVLWGFWLIHNVRAEVSAWRETAAKLLAIAERHGDPAMLLQAHHASWGNPALGDFASQLEHVARGLAHYDPTEHSRLAPQYGGHDAGVCGHCHRAIALWATGYPERAEESLTAALTLAEKIEHPQSKVHALVFRCWLSAFGSNWPETLRSAEAALALSTALGVPTFVTMAALMRGYALVGLGEAADGLAEMRRALETSSVQLFLTTYGALYAEALHLADATDEALAILDDALPTMEERGERLWKANALALKGDLLLARRLQTDAEVWYRDAIEVARAQSAKMWELRAATRLARLWHREGKTHEARELLAPIHGWFTEGFGTKDLKDGKALLEELSSPS